ncbi:helix-turn-helix domain-containing protein [Rubrivirga sp.]|uniref:helix-turn-helix domain-containing protein n=1 Tax=Rubrivirga sp. TaxID=1885344 RepID=UPI003C72938D
MPPSTRFDLPHGPQIPPFLGDVIRARREALGLTQEALAERCDLDRMQIGRIERAVINTTAKALARLAVGLQTYPDILMREARTALVDANPWYADAVDRGSIRD